MMKIYVGMNGLDSTGLNERALSNSYVFSSHPMTRLNLWFLENLEH